MITEIAHLNIKPGEELQFEKQVAKAKPYFQSAKGFINVSLHRCIEHPNQYELHVQWETLENHMVDFRESDGFAQWRAFVGEHFAAPPVVEHLSPISLG
jgi:heme-degrading monooxygenase HmoA